MRLTVEQVAPSCGIASSGQKGYALNGHGTPTEKGLSPFCEGAAVAEVADLAKSADQFFMEVEEICDEIAETQKKVETSKPGYQRDWRELRIRRVGHFEDTLTLQIQRLRESIGNLIKSSEDKDTGTELMEANRRLAELREGLTMFLSQDAEDHVYWVERGGRHQTNLTLNAAPIDISAYLRRRLFQSDTSIIMTSATLAIKEAHDDQPNPTATDRGTQKPPKGLTYFIQQVGAQKATALQLGSPFDYDQQMQLYVANQMPDPRAPDYQRALEKWILHFTRMTQGKAFVLFTNAKLLRDIAASLEETFQEEGFDFVAQGTGMPVPS